MSRGEVGEGARQRNARRRQPELVAQPADQRTQPHGLGVRDVVRTPAGDPLGCCECEADRVRGVRDRGEVGECVLPPHQRRRARKPRLQTRLQRPVGQRNSSSRPRT